MFVCKNVAEYSVEEENVDILLCTHGGLRRCSWIARTKRIKMLVVDEYHKTKNSTSAVNAQLEELKCRRILVSATPITTLDIWNVLEALRWLSPRIYGALRLERFTLDYLLMFKEIGDSLLFVCFL